MELKEDNMIMAQYSNWHKMPLAVSHSKDAPENETLFWDLKSEAHLLVSGITGGGKTSLLRCIASEAILRGFNVRIVDWLYGGANFAPFDGFADVEIAVTLEEIDSLLSEAVSRAEQRKEILQDNGCSAWYEMPSEERFVPEIFIIEEALLLASIRPDIDEEKALLASIRKNLSKLIRVGRPFGIHVAASTQRTNHHSVSEIEANFGTHAILGEYDYSASRYLDIRDPKNSFILNKRGRGSFANQPVRFFYSGDDSHISECLSLSRSVLREKSHTISSQAKEDALV